MKQFEGFLNEIKTWRDGGLWCGEDKNWEQWNLFEGCKLDEILKREGPDCEDGWEGAFCKDDDDKDFYWPDGNNCDRVPDGGSTVMLLGAALLGLAGFSRFRRSV